MPVVPAGSPAPYTFVPVVVPPKDGDRFLYEAVLHDGSATTDRLSGELRIELTARTPLLVGQHRYAWDRLGVAGQFDTDKNILEPALIEQGPQGWALVRPGRRLEATHWNRRRVLLPGSSLKGMLRQSIGALLNAPMERVAERWLSYRPNLGWAEGTLRYECREAVVVNPNPLEVVVLPAGRHAIFVREDATRPIGPAGTPLPAGGLVGYDYERRTDRRTGIARVNQRRLEPADGATFTAPAAYRILTYRGGIDGQGLLAARGTTGTTRTYHKALIPDARVSGQPSVLVPPEILDQYRQTARELSDATCGHLAAHPGKFGSDEQEVRREKDRIGKAILQAVAGLGPDQLIYVEIDTQQGGRIVSMGHHFRYRWRYADSPRRIQDGRTGRRDQPRPELSPLPGERLDASGGRLSGARVLFGYAVDKRSEESGTLGIGEKDYSRFAGRIAINHAIEHLTAGRDTAASRFLFRKERDEDGRFLLPLVILGTPKPSAVEHYLDQRGVGTGPGATRTCGDLPAVELSGVPLKGRKFYRHQPLTPPDGPLADDSPFLAQDPEGRQSDQATLARLVSRPGTRFRFSLRFRDLRTWELGALLLALQPALVAQIEEKDLPEEARDVVRAARKAAGSDPLFAQKLGYARPLGFGSVTLEVRAARLIAGQYPDPEQVPTERLLDWQRDALRAFFEETRGRSRLREWLQAMRYAGCTRAVYPTSRTRKMDGTWVDTIYAYHTQIRREHSVQRRMRDPDRQQEPMDRPVRLAVES